MYVFHSSLLILWSLIILRDFFQHHLNCAVKGKLRCPTTVVIPSPGIIHFYRSVTFPAPPKLLKLIRN